MSMASSNANASETAAATAPAAPTTVATTTTTTKIHKDVTQADYDLAVVLSSFRHTPLWKDLLLQSTYDKKQLDATPIGKRITPVWFENGRLHRALREKEDQQGLLKSKLSAVLAERNKDKTTITNLSAQLAELLQHHEELQREVATNSSEATMSRFSEESATIDALRIELELLENTVLNLRQDLDVANSTIQDLQHTAYFSSSSGNKKSGGGGAEIRDLTAELQECHAQLGALTAEKAELRQEVNFLQEEVNMLTRKVERSNNNSAAVSPLRATTITKTKKPMMIKRNNAFDDSDSEDYDDEEGTADYDSGNVTEALFSKLADVQSELDKEKSLRVAAEARIAAAEKQLDVKDTKEAGVVEDTAAAAETQRAALAEKTAATEAAAAQAAAAAEKAERLAADLTLERRAHAQAMTALAALKITAKGLKMENAGLLSKVQDISGALASAVKAHNEVKIAGMSRINSEELTPEN